MGDSWEDEEYEVPSIAVNISSAPKSFVDEEDLQQETSAAVSSGPSPAQLEALKKKKELEEKNLAQSLVFALQEKETPEEKKIRERKLLEDADRRLAGDLFDVKISSDTDKESGISLVSGIAGVSLKTREDHLNFGITVSTKLMNSTSFCISVFLKELSERIKGSLTIESLDEVIQSLQAIKEAKKRVAEPVKSTGIKKSKKSLKAEQKKHADVFGGDYEDSRYEHFSNLEDDFM